MVVSWEELDDEYYLLWGRWDGENEPVEKLNVSSLSHEVKSFLKWQAFSISSFIDQFPLGLVVASLESGKILHWNPPMELMTGWSAQEVKGKALRDFFDFSPQEVEEIRQNLLFGETLFLRNFRIINRFSEERLLNFHFFPWRQEKIIRTVAIVQDVTEKARWGESVRQMEKLSSIGRFISSVAHEINNPLAVIYGYTQMLLPRLAKSNSCETCKVVEKGLEKIEKEAEHCGKIIQYMVDFSRPMVLQKERVNLNTLIEESLALVDFYLDEQRKVELSLEENLPLVVVDATRIKQVFINLAKNAFEAMEGGGTLSITTRFQLLTPRLGEEGGRTKGKTPFVEIIFADTGKGIPPEKLNRIFEPFFSTKFKGAGLGLSISYGIIRAHRGFIEVDSVEGKGTQFRVFLPVEESNA